MADKKFEILAREALFQGYFRVDRFHIRHEKFHGGWTDPFTREVLGGGVRGVAVLLFDPLQDKVVLIEQFRACVMAMDGDPWMLEIVAGLVDSGEEPDVTARREAMEEAGCNVAELQPILGYYPSPGCLSQHMKLYIGRVSAPEDGSVFGVNAESEDIRVRVIDATQAIGYLYTGKIRDAASIIALQWFALRHTDLRSRWLVSDASTPII